MIKSSQKTKNRGEFYKLDKEHLQKCIANIVLNGETLNALPLKTGTGKCCLLSPSLFKTVLKVLASVIRQEKEIKGIQIGKEQIKQTVPSCK